MWPPLAPSVWLRRPVQRLPYPLDEPRVALHAWARHAIWRGVADLGLEPQDELLVPAFHHGSEVEALIRRDLRCRFYEGGEDLSPRVDELESMLTSRTRALYLVHYLGFPQDSARWRKWCDKRGLFLIEDAAQAWLSTHPDGQPTGSYGDLSVFCLYKTVGLPEGAISVGPGTPAKRPLDRRPGARELARRHAWWVVGRSGLATAGAALLRRRYPGSFDADSEFDLRDPNAMPWSTTRYLLRRLADPHTADLRRSNYAELLRELSELVPPPFDRSPNGASPFVFPIEAEDKARTLRGLRDRGIVALDLWSYAHPLLPVESVPSIARRRTRMIGLPVHQELRRVDLERIADAVCALC